MSAKKLTGKQQRFVEEYLVDLNVSQAARRAGYSPQTADVIGRQNMAKPHIRGAIEAGLAKFTKRNEIQADEVAQRLKHLGYASIADYATWDENGLKLIDSDKLTEDQQLGIVEVSQTKDGSVKVKLDKRGALEALGRYLGMFTDNLNMSGRLGIAHEDEIDDLDDFDDLDEKANGHDRSTA